RGFGPRFWGGTLQLSSRCSSIHFSPRRSLPVSTFWPFSLVGGASCAAAAARSNNEPSAKPGNARRIGTSSAAGRAYLSCSAAPGGAPRFLRPKLRGGRGARVERRTVAGGECPKARWRRQESVDG